MSAITKAELHRLVDQLDDGSLSSAQIVLAALSSDNQPGRGRPVAPAFDQLPLAVSQELFRLAALDDAALWRAARTRLARRAAERLARLNRKTQREGLTEAERAEADALLERGRNVTLRRAQAAFLLKQRGHDVRALLPNA